MAIRWAFAYPASLEPDGVGVMVTFRDLTGAITCGDTRAEALAEAPDCAEAALEFLLRDGDAPPPSDPLPGEVVVPLPLRMAAKIALIRSARANGIGPGELARRMKCDPKEAQRLLDPDYASKIDRLAKAVQAAGGPALELHAREVA
ncbi:type II toxin-antitoxin system HicB family antitoxin [Fodinicurvata sp. EGI_FJ10296]|uniref:type II toxin-antitoxin system HicB family antitoxin n=1 Tax=Fodinicurvata sp. EGI_FJ10296 TaxID=3231908 RepID=UPI0034549B66